MNKHFEMPHGAELEWVEKEELNSISDIVELEYSSGEVVEYMLVIARG